MIFLLLLIWRCQNDRLYIRCIRSERIDEELAHRERNCNHVYFIAFSFSHTYTIYRKAARFASFACCTLYASSDPENNKINTTARHSHTPQIIDSKNANTHKASQKKNKRKMPRNRQAHRAHELLWIFQMKCLFIADRLVYSSAQRKTYIFIHKTQLIVWIVLCALHARHTSQAEHTHNREQNLIKYLFKTYTQFTSFSKKPHADKWASA